MRNLFLTLSACLFIWACGGGNTVTPTPTNNSTMTVDKDGVTFTVTSFNNTLVSDQQGNEIGRRLDLRAEVDTGQLIISVSNWDWQSPPDDGVLIKRYDTNVDIDTVGTFTDCMADSSFIYCDAGLVTYLLGTQAFVSDFIDDEPQGQVIITKNDPATKTVSGSFDVVTQDIFRTRKITFKGTFTDLEYR